ncbi:hypothetical protein BOTBODRAFT_180488 [Botryobasidium botryosum FD-172 SS1]|uniref:MYND-type domain-containing protein n=1 Tax=Botryobasidium botryosum (strain FD-172 SS1) TaxID=930990 RepID=A0A067LWH8_BOTB1|nr:hypothetical protein BOTBODRAFT_180488 [Botryobasidium botryosum FD-172 SS1]
MSSTPTSASAPIQFHPVCRVCRRVTVNLCPGCNIAYYCNKKHMIADSETHRWECAGPPPLTAAQITSVVGTRQLKVLVFPYLDINPVVKEVMCVRRRAGPAVSALASALMEADEMEEGTEGGEEGVGMAEEMDEEEEGGWDEEMGGEWELEELGEELSGMSLEGSSASSTSSTSTLAHTLAPAPAPEPYTIDDPNAYSGLVHVHQNTMDPNSNSNASSNASSSSSEYEYDTINHMALLGTGRTSLIPILSDPLSNSHGPLAHPLVVVHRESYLRDGSPLNMCTGYVTVREALSRWAGNVVVLRCRRVGLLGQAHQDQDQVQDQGGSGSGSGEGFVFEDVQEGDVEIASRFFVKYGMERDPFH